MTTYAGICIGGPEHGKITTCFQPTLVVVEPVDLPDLAKGEDYDPNARVLTRTHFYRWKPSPAPGYWLYQGT
jgi:hypothetical protein